jgi:uncharacterized protein YvpB
MTSRPPATRALVTSLAVAGLLGALLVAWTCYQARQIQALRRQVDSLEMARRVAENEALRLAGSASALEERLAALEALDTGRQLESLRLQLEAEAGAGQTAELEAKLAGIQATVDGFQLALDDLAARIEPPEPIATPPPALPTQVRLQVPVQKQTHSLSCESSAAAMAAGYQGVPVAEEEVLAALPRHANPHLGFRGNVDGPTGGLEDYGVYAGPVLEVLKARGLEARPIEGGLAGIRAALARGNPVVAWITYNCQPGSPTAVTVDGQAVILVPYQHAVVLTGYNDEGVWANDPWDGQEDFYANADLERAMGYFGDMGIEVGPPSEQSR